VLENVNNRLLYALFYLPIYRPEYNILEWPDPYSANFTHLIKTEHEKYSFDGDAYYATDLENEDGMLPFDSFIYE